MEFLKSDNLEIGHIGDMYSSIRCGARVVYVLVKSSSGWSGCFVSPSDNSYVFFFFFSLVFGRLLLPCWWRQVVLLK